MGMRQTERNARLSIIKRTVNGFMKYTYLGKSGLKVSRLCLGTMNFGWNTEEKEAFRIMDAALDAGINFFDTANQYALGRTEEIIGSWFKQGGGRRERTVLATKVYNDMHDDNDGPNREAGYPHTKSDATWKARFAGCKRTISNCTKCTISTGT